MCIHAPYRNSLKKEVDRMSKRGILEKIKNLKTMKELDAIRLEVTKEMFANENENFHEIQKAFIKKKNKIRRNY